jgi:hypothetical protein
MKTSNLTNIDCCVDQIKEGKVDWAWSMQRRGVKCTQSLGMKISEGKRETARRRCRSEDNIGMPLRQLSWEGVEWLQLAQGRYQR